MSLSIALNNGVKIPVIGFGVIKFMVNNALNVLKMQ